jgi:hypothetical protein
MTKEDVATPRIAYDLPQSRDDALQVPHIDLWW